MKSSLTLYLLALRLSLAAKLQHRQTPALTDGCDVNEFQTTVTPDFAFRNQFQGQAFAFVEVPTPSICCFL